MLYLDSSALVKLVIPERESRALKDALGPDLASSALARTEVLRAVARTRQVAARRSVAEAVLDSLELVAVDAGILRTAETVRPATVRTLDAIHLASAAQFGNELEALITYDERMRAAAIDAGLDVFAPA